VEGRRQTDLGPLVGVHLENCQRAFTGSASSPKSHLHP
jgi:hypothetical protein